MAALEGEAMLLGIWKNIEDLENSICLEELELIVKSARDKEHRQQKFAAALRGINLDTDEQDNKERFEQVQKRAQAILSNKSAQEIERDEFADFGLSVEVINE